MTHRFFLKLWPEMRLDATVMTRKQNKQWANGKLLILQNQRRPNRFNQMLGSCWVVFFYANGIVHKEFVPPGQTVNQQFYLKVLKGLCDSVRKKYQKCGAAVIGSFTTTMPLPTGPWVCSSFWQKTTWQLSLILPIRLTLRHAIFPVPSYERPDEREMFCWCQRSKNENTGRLEQHQHWRVTEMLSAVGETLVQVYRVKRKVLWRRLEL